MSIADIIVIAVLLLAIVAAVIVSVKSRRKVPACSSSCASCSNRCHCKH